MRLRDWHTRGILLCVLVYLILTAAALHSVLPWCDEGWFSDPAWNLMTRGAMANTALDPTATWREVNLTGIDRHAYWIMPLYVVAQVPWYEIAGFGLMAMRWFSVFWGLVALLAWYRILSALAQDRAVALAALACMAVDFNLIFSASVGRMDMMAVALGSLGVAVYLELREKSLARALLLGNLLAACACLTHPNAVFFAADLLFLTLYLDRSRLRNWRAAAGLVLPYAAALAVWGAYIAEEPAVFAAQFLGNAGGAGGRFALFTHPLQSLRNEVVNRYLATFGAPPFSSGASMMKMVILLAFVASAVMFFGMRRFRSDRGYRALMGLFLIHVAMLAAIDGFKQAFYMIYVEPLWIALFAAVALHGWRSRTGMRWMVMRWMVATAVAAVLCVNLFVAASRWRTNPYRNRFLPAVEFLRTHPASVMASSEMGLELGFTPSLTDDFRLGYRSGKRARLIVLDEARYQPWIELLAGQDPGNYQFIQRLLREEYRLVYDRPGYKIYQRVR
jgi:hypothetical protein